ncbi:MAG: 6-phosphogluconolactonase [Candidatus Hydrogenedentota bacterium]
MADRYRVYIGTYTGGESEGIYLLDFDASSGALEVVGLAAETGNPSFLALHPTMRVLYAVGEMSKDAGRPGGAISAFSIDDETGLLTLLNQESTVGKGPCHVCVAPSGKHVAAANYGGGSTVLLPVLEDGRLGEASSFIQHEGSSVNPGRQEGPHAHSVNFDPTGRILIAADLGTDKLMLYRYEESGMLTPGDPPFASLAPGAGPRHVAVHPSGKFIYSVNELLSTVTAFAYDADSATLTEVQTIGTLPGSFEGENTTAEIRVHPSGTFLYASNRGDDSIAAFALNPETGMLTAIGHTSTGGKTPRNFNVDPSGRYLLAANQATDNVVVLRIDPETGTLTPTGVEVEVATPVCVVFDAVR